MGYFLDLTLGVVLLLVTYLAPITILLGAVWGRAFSAALRTPDVGRGRLFTRGCLPPFLFPVAILGCGAMLAHDSPSAVRVGFLVDPCCLIYGLLLVQFPLAAVAAEWWHEQRRVVVAAWACAGYVSLVTAFVSGMSVTGDGL